MSGCVASTISTPEAFIGSIETPSNSDPLAANIAPQEAAPNTSDISAASTSAPRVAEAPVKIEENNVAAAPETTQTAALVPTSDDKTASTQAQISSAATNTPQDVATSRINAASNAPLANGETAPANVNTSPAATALASANPKLRKNRPGFLNALFGSKPVPKAPVGEATKIAAAKVATPPAAVKPVTIVASASAAGATAALPGVDRDRALGVKKSTSSGTRIELASAGGLARLTPNGLKTQHAGVDVKCLKPALVRVLKTVERKYGKPAIVTSGYRSPARNKRARGAKNSLHIYCAAADIQVSGVSKWQLAKYLRSLPGRGGVGTYCHTKSVHIDIGPKRDWNWRCRRKK